MENRQSRRSPFNSNHIRFPIVLGLPSSVSTPIAFVKPRHNGKKYPSPLHSFTFAYNSVLHLSVSHKRTQFFNTLSIESLAYQATLLDIISLPRTFSLSQTWLINSSRTKVVRSLYLSLQFTQSDLSAFSQRIFNVETDHYQ